jgi:hypothetical protein
MLAAGASASLAGCTHFFSAHAHPSSASHAPAATTTAACASAPRPSAADSAAAALADALATVEAACTAGVPLPATLLVPPVAGRVGFLSAPLPAIAPPAVTASTFSSIAATALSPLSSHGVGGPIHPARCRHSCPASSPYATTCVSIVTQCPCWPTAPSLPDATAATALPGAVAPPPLASVLDSAVSHPMAGSVARSWRVPVVVGAPALFGASATSGISAPSRTAGAWLVASPLRQCASTPSTSAGVPWPFFSGPWPGCITTHPPGAPAAMFAGTTSQC